jgi:nucleotide-binding universal stress UspA family protein
MRMIVTWDGSGHGLGALRDLVPLLRGDKIDHIEILLTIWPPHENALWADIRDQQFISDDLHQAAAQVATTAAARLHELLAPLSASIATSTASGERSELILKAIENSQADVVMIVIGNHDPTGTIREGVQDVVNASGVPTWIVRAPGVIAPPPAK